MLHRYLHRNRALRFLGPKRLFGFAQRLESFRSLNSRERPLFLQERTIESLVWVTEAGRSEPLVNPPWQTLRFVLYVKAQTFHGI